VVTRALSSPTTKFALRLKAASRSCNRSAAAIWHCSRRWPTT